MAELESDKSLIKAEEFEGDEVQQDIPDDEFAFLSGSFGQGLDLDLFGFKELGIDAGPVPEHLLLDSSASSNKLKPDHRDVSTTSSSSTARSFKDSTPHPPRKPPTPAEKDSPCLFTPPPPFSPITDPTLYIGLIQPFLRRKLEESQGKDPEETHSQSKSKYLDHPHSFFSDKTVPGQRDVQESSIRRSRGRAHVERGGKRKTLLD